MRLVVDANVLISALLRDGTTRHQLFTTEAHLFAPRFLQDEIHRHRDMILKRSELDDDALDELIATILDQIIWVPDDAIEPYLDPAAKALADVDPKDVPYLACALAVEADGIWSRDRDFDGQGMVRRVEGVG